MNIELGYRNQVALFVKPVWLLSGFNSETLLFYYVSNITFI